jgi:hypothetical protein
MEKLTQHIQEWFMAKREYFESFARNDTRVESWFKAELLVLFERLKSERSIDSFERETNLRTAEGRQQIDFRVKIEGVEHLCELKAMCISQALETPRNLRFYFRDDPVGLIKDFKKLDKVADENKWVLAFIYPKPSESGWQETLTSLPENIQHWRCVTSIKDYPEYLFIALWKS